MPLYHLDTDFAMWHYIMLRKVSSISHSQRFECVCKPTDSEARRILFIISNEAKNDFQISFERARDLIPRKTGLSSF
jgi:hypothetical protein